MQPALSRTGTATNKLMEPYDKPKENIFFKSSKQEVSFVCYLVIKQTLVDEVMGSIPF